MKNKLIDSYLFFYLRMYVSKSQIEYFDSSTNTSVSLGYRYREIYFGLYFFSIFCFFCYKADSDLGIAIFQSLTWSYILLDALMVYHYSRLESGNKNYNSYKSLKFYNRFGFVGSVNVILALVGCVIIFRDK